MKRKNIRKRRNKCEIVYEKLDGEDIVPIYNTLGSIIGLWVCIYPVPFKLSIIIGMITATAGFIIMLIYNKSTGFLLENRPYPFVGIVISINSIGVLFQGFYSSNTIYSSLFWIYFALCCMILILLVVLLKRDAFMSIVSAVILVLAIAAYSAGIIINTNYLFDNSKPAVYSAYITGKDFFKARMYNGSIITTYDIALTPLENSQENTTAHVSKDFYDAVDNYEGVQVYLKHGLLGIKWYYIST